jgi:NTE family protein
MSVSNQNSGPEVTLVLQGGGALGAYQVGAYKAMREYGQEPTVLSGISIGAVNAAIIAGNKPENRLARLEQFWQMVSWPSSTDYAPAALSSGYLDAMHHAIGIWQAFMIGQPNFFKPRWVNPWLATPGTAEATSFEDTSMLRSTLEKLIDFELINGSERNVRLFIGAVKVTTGEMVFFDSFKEKITVDHVMASGALPPGFPGVRIDGDLYWDGGCCSNTVIDVALEQNPHVDKRIFMPTLFNPVGPEPKNMDEVLVRQQDIQYASRSVRHVKEVLERHELKRKLRLERRAKQEAQLAAQKESGLAGLGLNTAIKPLIDIRRSDERLNRLEIVHVMYRSPVFEGVRRDTDFARQSIKRRTDAGFADMHLAVKDSAWVSA